MSKWKKKSFQIGPNFLYVYRTDPLFIVFTIIKLFSLENSFNCYCTILLYKKMISKVALQDLTISSGTKVFNKNKKQNSGGTIFCCLEKWFSTFGRWLVRPCICRNILVFRESRKLDIVNVQKSSETSSKLLPERMALVITHFKGQK